MTKSQEPLVSVVTPVYNGEPFLDECIQSVLDQSYENWDFVIVNNCSTDNSLEIARKYAQHEPRIRILDNSEFLSHLQNSNHAFQQISEQSKYCKVLHADDWLFPGCLDQMVEIAEAHPSVAIVGSYGLWGEKVVSDRLPYPSSFVPGPTICRDTLLGSTNPFWSPTSILIRSDVMRHRRPFYDEDHLHADVEACYEVLQHHDFGFVHQVLTFIRKHEESITSTVAAPLNKLILTNIDLFMRYGPIYLEPKEYRSQLNLKFKKYYSFLAQSLFRLRGRDFWTYHSQTLQEMGCPLRKKRLLGAALREFVNQPVAVSRLLVRSVGRSST